MIMNIARMMIASIVFINFLVALVAPALSGVDRAATLARFLANCKKIIDLGFGAAVFHGVTLHQIKTLSTIP